VSRTRERLLAGRYELADPIATGGMAEVFEATDTRLGRSVAVKVLREAIADRPEMRERMHQEVLLAARLHHPNVVAVLDGGVEDGHPFLVMERLHGSTLADLLGRRGRVDPKTARAVGLQMLAAVAAAHRLGIVHRDIKPANVLRAPEGIWKIADFGIATSLGDHTLTRTGEILGSPAYLAPERLMGRRATPAADIYAVGVVLYEALAGRKPFDGDDPWQVATAIRSGEFTPLDELRPGVPPQLVRAVERAMATDPADRFPSADAFAAAIDGTDTVGSSATTVIVPALDATRVMPSALGSAGTVSPGIPARPDRRRTMQIAGMLAAVALLAVITLGGALLLGATTSTPPAPSHLPAASSTSAAPSGPPTGSPAPAATGRDDTHGNGHGSGKPGKGPKDH
jgi:eukaryotic-like serine/threonine-protein kinase